MTESAVSAHYSQAGLEQRILDALVSVGADPERLSPDELAPVDEFHVGGRLATVNLTDHLDLRTGMRVLDVGSGLGGTARYLASTYGVQVTGIDLTPDYVRVATSLARRAGLAERTRFVEGTATELPFADGSFDRACMLHVGMNIADKAAAFREVRRVLADGGLFCVYDIMRTGPGELRFPVPWSDEPSTSVTESPERYRTLLAAAGLPLREERDQREFGIDFLRTLLGRLAESGTPPLGIHLLTGPTAPVKFGNVLDAFERGVLAPVEMVSVAE